MCCQFWISMFPSRTFVSPLFFYRREQIYYNDTITIDLICTIVLFYSVIRMQAYIACIVHISPDRKYFKEPAGQSYSCKIAYLHSVDFFPKQFWVITFDIKPVCAVFPSSCLISCLRYSWGKGKQLQCSVVLWYSQAQHQVLLLFDLQDSPLDIAAWVCWTQPQVYCSE